MNSRDDILALINSLCITWADAQLAHERSRTAATPEIHADQHARAQRAHEATQQHYNALQELLTTSVPDDVNAEEFLPVQPLPTGEVAIHARDDHANSVRLRLTGAQALTLGAHLTAYAAISLDRSGFKVAEALPRLPADVEPPMHPAPALSPAPAPSPLRITGKAPVVPGTPPSVVPHPATR
jgi:ribosomal protein L16 Arg81 hydroxylase